MKMTGEYDIPAPRQKVWDALNDPAVLQEAIPGAEAVERVGDNAFTLRARAKVGPVRMRFTGKAEITESDPPNSYTLTAEGNAGPAGIARGVARVRLEDAGEGTRLMYEAEASVGGKLAQIGQRLVDAAAASQARTFFGRFATIVGGEKVEAAPVAAAAERPRGGLSPWIWGPVLGIVIVLVVVWAAVTY